MKAANDNRRLSLREHAEGLRVRVMELRPPPPLWQRTLAFLQKLTKPRP